MYKFLGNFPFDNEINLNDFTFHSHKINKHSDKDSVNAKSLGYGDNTEMMKCWGEDFPTWLNLYVDKFPMVKVNANFQMQKPGCIIPPHKDSFDMIKNKGFTEKAYRILVCMNDWIFGQVIMVEDKIITNWKKGDAYIWDSEAIHMSANGSLENKLTMIISGFYEDN